MDGQPRYTLEQRIGNALKLLNDGLKVFLEQALKKIHADKWVVVAHDTLSIRMKPTTTNLEDLDTKLLLALLTKSWQDLFLANSSLEMHHKNIAHELHRVRNAWAHQAKFTTEDTYRALDNIERLLIAIGGYNEAFKVSEEKKDVVLIFANEIVFERQTKQNVPQHYQTSHAVHTNHNNTTSSHNTDMMDM